MTITLPSFGKDFERSLDLGYVDPTLFLSFKKRASLPAFLQGLTGQVFDPCGGLLLDSPNVDAIHAVRQVSYLLSKVELECSPERVYDAYKGYIECEKQVRAHMEGTICSSQRIDFRRVSFMLFQDIFADIDRKVYQGEVVPKHGPGATADKLRGNAKYQNRVWTERLETEFPAMDFLFPNPRYYPIEDGEVQELHWLDPGTEMPVKVITVPKTLKTPRIIAIEPTHMQYVQQGMMEMFVKAIERSDSLSGAFIGFTDQEPNRILARKGSMGLGLATLDLSEASDRVSTLHVEDLFANYPSIYRGVMACRSSKAEVPGFGLQTLSKYASMGSALTFPIEAMVFLTIVFLGIEAALGKPLTEELIREFRGQVRVYGDDIIVPVEFARSVARSLQDFGLVVNERKSFWTGKFRESCGGDYYDGFDVTVVKCRMSMPQSRKDVREIESLVSLRNQLYLAGYWGTCASIDEYIKRFIPFPILGDRSPGLGRRSHLPTQGERDCPHLQRPLIKAAVSVSRIPASRLSDGDALLKWFLKRGDEPFADEHHLERSGRPESVDIKLRWVPTD